MDNQLHEYKHKEIDTTLNEHSELLKTHGEQISTLNKNDAVHDEQIGSLCKKLDAQTNAIWGLVICIIGALLAYFFAK